MTRILNPVIWLWIFSALNLFVGAGQGLVDGQSVAEMGWGSDNTGAHDAFYETNMSIMMCILSILAAGIALFTSGLARARMTTLLGVSMIGTIVVWLTYGSSNNYDTGGPIIILPFAIFALLTLSGILSLKSSE
ncbi:MAG TPA: hypothetical protein EYQ00_04630 [Dehalococcoidia bacterium]|jgi:hypothetical protein|nr:hypothetical protein [Dehalococcoidia bacterium]